MKCRFCGNDMDEEIISASITHYTCPICMGLKAGDYSHQTLTKRDFYDLWHDAETETKKVEKEMMEDYYECTF